MIFPVPPISGIQDSPVSNFEFILLNTVYGLIARKLYRGLFPKSIFQSTSTAQNELNIVSLYLWLYEKPRRPPKIPFQFLSKLNSTKKKKMTVFDGLK